MRIDERRDRSGAVSGEDEAFDHKLSRHQPSIKPRRMIMSEKETKQQPAVVEDLSIKESEAESVKGGAAVDYFLTFNKAKGDSSLRGDANSDGSVDAADYAVWRNNFGSGL
jgi:hypothetical protein